MKYQLKGPNQAVATSCSTSAHAISDAVRMIMMGEVEVMLAGGSECAISRLGITGFSACRALSTRFNDSPEKASRPFDRERDGFVMGEGASMLVLEEWEHARKRGAKIYGEVVGYGLSADAFHMTAPPEDGDGAYRCMLKAMKMAGITPEEVDYVNAHGTSTSVGDRIELQVLDRIFASSATSDKNMPLISSTKSSIGHLLGAAGATEAIFSLLSMRDGVAPPTLNLHNPCFKTKLDLVPHVAKEKKMTHVMSNSFGFGGTNVSLLFKAV